MYAYTEYTVTPFGVFALNIGGVHADRGMGEGGGEYSKACSMYVQRQLF